MFDHNFIIFVVDLTETFNFTHSETMHEIDHEEVFIIAKPICQQMDNRSKKQDASQCAGTDLNKRFLPKPMTTTG